LSFGRVLRKISAIFSDKSKNGLSKNCDWRLMICAATSSVSCNFNPAIDCELAITEFFLKWESDKIVVYRILHRREAYR